MIKSLSLSFPSGGNRHEYLPDWRKPVLRRIFRLASIRYVRWVSRSSAKIIVLCCIPSFAEDRISSKPIRLSQLFSASFSRLNHLAKNRSLSLGRWLCFVRWSPFQSGFTLACSRVKITRYPKWNLRNSCTNAPWPTWHPIRKKTIKKLQSNLLVFFDFSCVCHDPSFSLLFYKNTQKRLSM